MRQKVIKTGNSLAVTIPADFVKNYGLKPGSTVNVRPDLARGTLHLAFPSSGQLTLLPKIGPRR
ncbi:hypothetical protein A3H89_00415 [Candidatus Amesbacteria bacterium RIFCSPLOWO2_02_FULL_48_11]|uniref:SpoVT-AbrB domain-containing protein n=4 Tax=Candidatus Amesiibacteriota TaxID=1752730 RepID=A0A1F4ZB10_9BACT|nr:MAG: hypothetical protein UX78_C0015G0054 [Candidatus Amesbacteria bacterium GW2011_GWA2_47_11]KKU98787.1 MAG: hypothetical protein UY33_C0044G0004 [Candidatus Amesbacteria bacterium GW2011_GWA1_48_9]OGC89386.1 MAG: hypothetical protein A2V48_00925 [Candidatus Amesbacteria bacterium RBG_19FT_COMBO_48_16]OGD02917.1 MAG: hypothetical protein A2354_02360 [Candidatus Amesbacteria bacterium RIFOXYB1_FULL_47_12]OGD03077.1 MAG: hypothetical protein A3E17_02210 [Candidatus Amesbacteria bacterium RIF